MRYEVDANGETWSGDDEQTPDAMKARIRRLEDALAAMQDMQLMEERVVSRLLERMSGAAPPALTPAPVQPLVGEAPTDAETGAPTAPPPVKHMLPMLTLPPAAAAVFNASINTSPQSWLIVEIWRELRLMVGMFTDYRFQVNWLARLAPVFLVAGLILSYFFVGRAIPLLGPFLEPLADALLGVVCYKVLAREAARYRREVGQKPYYRA